MQLDAGIKHYPDRGKRERELHLTLFIINPDLVLKFEIVLIWQFAKHSGDKNPLIP